jgi:predicted alpha/beta-hydrolase family hydrolase
MDKLPDKLTFHSRKDEFNSAISCYMMPLRGVFVVEQTAIFKEVQIPLVEPIRGNEFISAVLGIPEWWPTCQRVAMVIAHDADSDLNHPLLEHLQDKLTNEKFLTLRFNFPFAEAHEPASADTGEILTRTFRTAIAALHRDPTTSPAHVFIGGHGLGARVAAQIATTQVRIGGTFLISFPLHAVGEPEAISAEQLYRITSPTLFVQGSRDHQCDLGSLVKTARRMGTTTEIRSVEDADENFAVPGESLRSSDEIYDEVCNYLLNWSDKHYTAI